MKLLVTGICGRLGRALSREAAQQRVELVGLDIVDWPGQAGAIPPGVAVHRGSYEDLDRVEPLLEGCTGIVHAGGPHGGHVKTLGLDAFIHAHTVSLVRLLEAARRRGAKHAVLSSTMELLIGRDGPASGAAFLDEDSPVRTDSSYSLSRYLMECMGKEYARQTGMSIANLRYMAFGYVEDSKAGPRLLSRTISASDVARAVLLAASKDYMVGEVMHIGPDTPVTAQDIGLALSDPRGVLEKHFPGATAVLQARNLEVKSGDFWPITSIRKAKLVLDWEPRYSFRHWLLENGWEPPRHPPA